MDKGERQRLLTRFDFQADFSAKAAGMTVTQACGKTTSETGTGFGNLVKTTSTHLFN